MLLPVSPAEVSMQATHHLGVCDVPRYPLSSPQGRCTIAGKMQIFSGCCWARAGAHFLPVLALTPMMLLTSLRERLAMRASHGNMLFFYYITKTKIPTKTQLKK